MYISIEKKEFVAAVNNTSRFSDKKNSSLPVLSTILIIAADDGIKMRATNLEIGIDLKLEGTIKSNGVVAVPTPILVQIAHSLTQEGILTLEHTGDILSIKSNTGRSLVKTIPHNDFPSIPFPENPKNKIIISGQLLKQTFSALAACAATSTIRPELASLYLSAGGGLLTIVATDSFRLVEKKIPISNKGTQGTLLIPAKNATDIVQAIPDDEIIISFNEHQCALISTKGFVVSRLTNAVYPDYKQIIPKESVTEATLLTKDLETALKKTAIFSDAFQKITLQFNPKKSQLTIFAKNTETGESTEIIPARISGSAIDLPFNHKYLSPALSLTQTESIVITTPGIGRPLLIRGVGDNTFLYLVSPMNQ